MLVTLFIGRGVLICLRWAGVGNCHRWKQADAVGMWCAHYCGVCSNLSIALVHAATFSPLVVEVCCLVCVDLSVMLIVASWCFCFCCYECRFSSSASYSSPCLLGIYFFGGLLVAYSSGLFRVWVNLVWAINRGLVGGRATHKGMI